MAKWPKGVSKKFNAAVRAGLVPVFKERAFQNVPPPGLDGVWDQSAFRTNLFRPNGADVDIVEITVPAYRGELYAGVEAVRATGYLNWTIRLPEIPSFPLEDRFDVQSRSWLGFRNDFKLGPPWPADMETAMQAIVAKMVERLPPLFEYLETGRTRAGFWTRVQPRYPLEQLRTLPWNRGWLS